MPAVRATLLALSAFVAAHAYVHELPSTSFAWASCIDSRALRQHDADAGADSASWLVRVISTDVHISNDSDGDGPHIMASATVALTADGCFEVCGNTRAEAAASEAAVFVTTIPHRIS